MKKRVAIIGVTGSVGQEFVQSLDNHPWFEVTQIAASERSAGKMYLDAIRDAGGIIAWDVGGEIPEYTGMMAQAREQALQRMLDRAKELNADAVVGVRFQTSMVLQGSAELLAYGTAVKLTRN